MICPLKVILSAPQVGCTTANCKVTASSSSYLVAHCTLGHLNLKNAYLRHVRFGLTIGVEFQCHKLKIHLQKADKIVVIYIAVAK